MDALSGADQKILLLLSEGLSDREICVQLHIGMQTLERAVHRIEARATHESEDAGRFFERALKVRAQRINAGLTARLRALMDSIPQSVFVVDGQTGQVKEFNAETCNLFGYTPSELSQLSVENLVPLAGQDRHVALRIGFLASTRRREMGYHPPIRGLRKDGSEVEMAIALTATAGDDDVMVICTPKAHWLKPQLESKPV